MARRVRYNGPSISSSRFCCGSSVTPRSNPIRPRKLDLTSSGDVFRARVTLAWRFYSYVDGDMHVIFKLINAEGPAPARSPAWLPAWSD